MRFWRRVTDRLYFWTHRWFAKDLTLTEDMIAPKRLVIRNLTSRGGTLRLGKGCTLWVTGNIEGGWGACRVVSVRYGATTVNLETRKDGE